MISEPEILEDDVPEWAEYEEAYNEESGLIVCSYPHIHSQFEALFAELGTVIKVDSTKKDIYSLDIELHKGLAVADYYREAIQHRVPYDAKTGEVGLCGSEIRVQTPRPLGGERLLKLEVHTRLTSQYHNNPYDYRIIEQTILAFAKRVHVFGLITHLPEQIELISIDLSKRWEAHWRKHAIQEQCRFEHEVLHKTLNEDSRFWQSIEEYEYPRPGDTEPYLGYKYTDKKGKEYRAPYTALHDDYDEYSRPEKYMDASFRPEHLEYFLFMEQVLANRIYALERLLHVAKDDVDYVTDVLRHAALRDFKDPFDVVRLTEAGEDVD